MKRAIALATLSCFILSSVAKDVSFALAVQPDGIQQCREVLDDFTLPPATGKVTGGKYYGSDRVVINIQDLHCNAEVQRNIARILKLLDDKYGLGKVYIEGAVGDIDTSWLCDIKDRKLKKEIVESLLEQGRLTGTEYYSITADRPYVLAGLEDEQLYRKNLQRLDIILGKQAACEKIVSLMNEDLSEMKERYFSGSNRRFDTLISQYNAGKTNAGRYFQLLVRYAEKLNKNTNSNICAIELAHYQNMTGYIDLINAGRKLHYKSISRQLQGFTRELRQKLSYNVYLSLLTKTDNFKKLDELYIALARLSREYHLETERRYPQLGEFFEYIEKTQHVNPLTLLKEEKQLAEEIRTGLSRDTAEMEVTFLSDFFTYFKDYLANRLTADDYEYFVSRFDDFKTLWARYAGNDRFSLLKDDLALLDTFYRVNLERNNCFLRVITGQAGLQSSLRQGHDDTDGMARAAQNAKEITVVVAGGFHTQGLEKLLDRQGITHYTITPGVNGDAAASDIIYAELMHQQAKILSQALAPMTASALEKLLAEGPLTDRNIRSAEVFLSMLLQAAAPVVHDREKMDGRLDRLFNGIAVLKKFRYGIREGRGTVAWQLTLAADGKELQFDYLKDGRIRFGKISAKENPFPKKKTLFNTLWAGTAAGIISGTTIAAAGFLLAGIWWLGLPAVFLFTFDALRNGVHIILAAHNGRIPEELNLIEELAPLKDLDQLPPGADRTPGRYTLAVTYKGVIYINRRVLRRLSPDLQRRTFDHETWHLRLDRIKKRKAIAAALLQLSLIEETIVSVLEHFNAADNTGKAPLAAATPRRADILQKSLLKIRSLSGPGNVRKPIKTGADKALRKQQQSADTTTGATKNQYQPRQWELLAKPTTIEPERLSRIRERINHLKIEAGATRFLLGNIRQSDSETIRAVEILTSDTNSFVFSSSFGNFLAGTYPFVSKIRMLHLLADLAEVKSRIWPYWSYWPWKGLTVSFWEQLSTAKIDDKTAQVIIMGTIEGNRADVTNITDALRILNSAKFNFVFSTSFSDFIKEPIGSSYKMDTLRLLMEVAKKKPDMGNDWDWTKFTIPFWRQLGALQPGPEAARFIMDTLQKGERNTTSALEILIAEGFLSYGFLDYLAGPADDNTKTKMLLLLDQWIKERTSASRKIIIMAHPAFFWEWLSRQPEDERTPFPLDPRYAYEWLRRQPGKDRTKFSELPQYLRAWLDNRPQEKRILYPGESPDHPILPKEPERKLVHRNTGINLKMPENRFGPGTHVILGELLLKAVRTVTGDDPLIVQTGSPTYLMAKDGTLTPDYDRIDDFDFRIHSRKRIYKDTEQQILTLFGDYLKAEGFTIEHTEEQINEERVDHLWIAEKHGDKKYEIDIHILSMDDLFGETAGNVANDADPFKLALYIPDDIFLGSDDTLSQLSDRLTEAGNDGILGTVTLKYKGIYAYVADDISYYSDRDFRNIKFLKRLYLLAVMRGKQKDFEYLLDAYMQFEKEPAARSIDIDDIIVRTASDLMKKRHLNSQLDYSRKLDDKSRKDFDVLMDRALKELDPASGQLSVDLRDTINRHIAPGSVTAQGTTSIDTKSGPGAAKASGSFQPASIFDPVIRKIFPVATWQYKAITGLFAPFMEELVFRLPIGAFSEATTESYSLATAAVASAVLFAAVHIIRDLSLRAYNQEYRRRSLPGLQEWRQIVKDVLRPWKDLSHIVPSAIFTTAFVGTFIHFHTVMTASFVLGPLVIPGAAIPAVFAAMLVHSAYQFIDMHGLLPGIIPPSSVKSRIANQSPLSHENPDIDLTTPDRFGANAILGELLLKAAKEVTGDDALVAQMGSSIYFTRIENGRHLPDYEHFNDFDFRIYLHKRTVSRTVSKQVITVFARLLAEEGFTVKTAKSGKTVSIMEPGSGKKYTFDMKVVPWRHLLHYYKPNVLSLYNPYDYYFGSEETMLALDRELSKAGLDKVYEIVLQKYLATIDTIRDRMGRIPPEYRHPERLKKLLKRLYLVALMQGRSEDFRGLLDVYANFSKLPHEKIQATINDAAEQLIKKQSIPDGIRVNLQKHFSNAKTTDAGNTRLPTGTAQSPSDPGDPSLMATRISPEEKMILTDIAQKLSPALTTPFLKAALPLLVMARNSELKKEILDYFGQNTNEIRAWEGHEKELELLGQVLERLYGVIGSPNTVRLLRDIMMKGDRDAIPALEILSSDEFKFVFTSPFIRFLSGDADYGNKKDILILISHWTDKYPASLWKDYSASFWEWLSTLPENERSPFPANPPEFLYPAPVPGQNLLKHTNSPVDVRISKERFGMDVNLGEVLLETVFEVTKDKPLIAQAGSFVYLPETIQVNGQPVSKYSFFNDIDFRIYPRLHQYSDSDDLKKLLLAVFFRKLAEKGLTVNTSEWSIVEPVSRRQYKIDMHIFFTGDLFPGKALDGDRDVAIYYPGDIFTGDENALNELNYRLTDAGTGKILGLLIEKYQNLHDFVTHTNDSYTGRSAEGRLFKSLGRLYLYLLAAVRGQQAGEERNIKILKRLYLLAAMRGKQAAFDYLMTDYIRFEQMPAGEGENMRILKPADRRRFDAIVREALGDLAAGQKQLSSELQQTMESHLSERADKSVPVLGSVHHTGAESKRIISAASPPGSIIGKTILKHRNRPIDLEHTAVEKRAAYENSVQQVFELLKPLSIAGITRKIQLQHTTAGPAIDPAARKNGAIYHITRTPVDVTASILSGRKNGSTHIIVTPADQGDIGDKPPFMMINGQRIWRGQAGQKVLVFYLEQNRSFEQGAAMVIRRLTDKTDTDLNYNPLAVVSDITTYKELPRPLVDGAAYVINGNPELINWGDARGVDRVVENLYQIAGDEALAVYGEAIRQKQGENYIKGRELTLGINGELIAAKGNRGRLLRLVKETGAGNLRLKGEPAAILKQDIAGLRTADAGFSLKVLGEFRIPEGADLSPALMENVVSLVRSSGQPDENRFDGLEIDARQWKGTAEQLTEWLTGVSSGRPDARFTLNLSGQMKQSSGKYLRENLPPSVKLINEPDEAPNAEGRYVKITVGKGFDLLRIMAEIERVNADSFEISFENEVLQGVLVENIVKGLLERISEDSPDITYQLAFNTVELSDKTEADELARILLAIKLDVKGRDFRGAAGRIDMGEMDWATEKIEHHLKQGSALYTSFKELTERYHSATQDSQKESAAANVVAFLKGIEDAGLLRSYLDRYQRRGFERDSDRMAFAGILWKFRQFIYSEIESRQGDYHEQVMSDAQADPAKALNFIDIMMIMGRLDEARQLLHSIRPATAHWSAQSLYRYIELADSAGITDLSGITAMASAVESKWDKMDKIYRYNAIGGDGEEIRQVLNELAPQLKYMVKGNLVPYAKAYVKYGGFSYAETITMIERIRDEIGENADADDPVLLVANFQILDLLNNEKMKIDNRPRELRIDTRSIMAMLGAA